MKEERADLWKCFGQPGHRIGISTNGYIKRNGCAVMGRGCAFQATQLFPEIAKLLGSYIVIRGNTPGYLFIDSGISGPAGDRLMILPVKHNWYERASIDLVTASIAFLHSEATAHDGWTFHVPRLGCGNGKLSWLLTVVHLMEPLPNNVVVHS